MNDEQIALIKSLFYAMGEDESMYWLHDMIEIIAITNHKDEENLVGRCVFGYISLDNAEWGSIGIMKRIT